MFEIIAIISKFFLSIIRLFAWVVIGMQISHLIFDGSGITGPLVWLSGYAIFYVLYGIDDIIFDYQIKKIDDGIEL